MQREQREGDQGTDARFGQTHWSVVLAAAGAGNVDRKAAALESLCHSYWAPLYAFARRQGHSPHDAQDIVQDFLTSLIVRDDFRTVAPGKGRFRSFLLACLRHFLANRRARGRARKRGGDSLMLSLDVAGVEAGLADELAAPAPSETVFDRQWARSLLARAVARLREEYESTGRGRLFASLRPTLAQSTGNRDYAALGQASDLRNGAVKVAVHRLRRRFRTLIREEIAMTVSEPADVEDEMTYLVSVLAEDSASAEARPQPR